MIAGYQVPSRYHDLQLQRRLARHAHGTPPHVLFAGSHDDFWLWLHTEGRQCRAGGEVVPGLPDEQVQRTANGLSGDAALADGFLVYRLVRGIFEGLRGDLSSARVLDFGVGWGRVIRFFLKDVDGERLWGIDHYDKMIAICRETNPWCNFQHTQPFPPSSFENGFFDLVFAYSVFSHLSEPAHLKWIEEFARIVRPGGVVVVTTWDRELIVRCGQLGRETELPSYQAHLPTIFQPTADWLHRYDSGEFCFDSSPTSYGDISWYLGEACVPEPYVRRHWAKHMDVVDYVDDRSVCTQNVIVLTC